ncbi:PPOX class F420-dependent oxidoreductase [Streptomyces sp. NPDC056464]|uniref:PPOX class F420-dependent oxidoreductase n=1 Tax=Streptomyces sp. NPDC056464 TaxID=3345828 RepID=UPI0036BF5FAB
MTTSASDPILFDDSVRSLLDGRNFAGVATLGPDGAPQNSVVWIKREGDTVLFSSVDARQKVRNLRRDPRISVSVYDLTNPYSSVEIRGPPGPPAPLRHARLAARRAARPSARRAGRCRAAGARAARAACWWACRSTAQIVPDEAKRLPFELSHKYLGIDPPAESDDESRVIIRVVPRKIVRFSA